MRLPVRRRSTGAGLRSTTLVAPLVVALAAALAGCGTQTVEVPYTAEAVELSVGEVLVLDMGTVNASIGDAWEVTTVPDPAVLGAAELESDARDDAPPGTGAHHRYRFRAVAPGTTTIGLTYSYRGEPGDVVGRVADPDPEVVVTVTG